MAILLFPSERKIEAHKPPGWMLNEAKLLALPADSAASLEALQQAASAGHKHYQLHRSARSMAAALLPALRAKP
jgi:hypothetical protein